jgi:hypothetical protein
MSAEAISVVATALFIPGIHSLGLHCTGRGPQHQTGYLVVF